MLLLELVTILALTLLNGLLAMSELAVVSARRARLQQLAAAGHRSAAIALRLIDDPGRFLSTVQIGITLVGIFAGAFGGATLAARLGTWLDTWPVIAPHGRAVAIAVVVVGITYLSLILGELVPKRIALRRPERVATAVAPFMHRLSRLAAPAVWVLRTSTEAILRLLGLQGTREATITEDEVRILIAEGTRAGIFAPREREMIEGVLRLADRSVRVIMTPRTEVAWLDLEDDRETIGRKLEAARFSRYPVCQGSIDHPVGVVHTKDLLPVALAGLPIDLARSLVPPLVAHDRATVLKLLERFQKEGIHMAVVVDEYGATEGIATPIDILEAIAGELPELGEKAGPALVRRADGSWLVDAALPIDEFEDRLGLRGLRGQGDFDTVAGFVLHRLGHLPRTGESFAHAGAIFEVVDMDGRRIDKVLVRPPRGSAPVLPSGPQA